MKKRLFATITIAMIALSLGTLPLAAAGDGHEKGKDIVATAQGAGAFNTLLAAAKAAGLVGALQGEGPLTVFAPTDEAFAKLPEGTIETLLKPENKEKLANILKYHVISGKIMAADVKNGASAETLLGQKLDFKVNKKGVSVGGAKVVSADVGASNGVIHVIDTVLLPSE